MIAAAKSDLNIRNIPHDVGAKQAADHARERNSRQSDQTDPYRLPTPTAPKQKPENNPMHSRNMADNRLRLFRINLTRRAKQGYRASIANLRRWRLPAPHPESVMRSTIMADDTEWPLRMVASPAAQCRPARAFSRRCEAKQDEQTRRSRHCFSKLREPVMTSAAYPVRLLRHHRCDDLPCHRSAQAIVFYLRLLPCQPRATQDQNKRRAYRPAVCFGDRPLAGTRPLLAENGRNATAPPVFRSRRMSTSARSHLTAAP
jgi:hypothetical protein